VDDRGNGYPSVLKTLRQSAAADVFPFALGGSVSPFTAGTGR
jgi:hypothetical protein